MAAFRATTVVRAVCVGFELTTAAWFALRAVADELQHGTPAVRGLVHAGICLLVAAKVAIGSQVATQFAGLGLALCAYYAALSDEVFVGVRGALVAAAFEVVARVPFSPHSASLAVGLALCIPGAQDPLPFAFHAAFVANLGSLAIEQCTLLLVASVTLSLNVLVHATAPVLTAALIAWATVRGAIEAVSHAVAARQSDGLAQDEPLICDWKTVGAVRRSPVVDVCVWVYALALVAVPAASRREVELTPLEFATHSLHVAAVAGSLREIVPRAIAERPALRFAVVPFPLADACLCVARMRLADRTLICALGARAVGATAIACSLIGTLPEVGVAIEAAPPRRHVWSDRTLLLLYAGVHGAMAACNLNVEDGLSMTFHYLVVTLSMAYLAVVKHDVVAHSLAVVFLATEAATNTCLAVARWPSADYVGWGACAATALALWVRVSVARADRLYAHAMLSPDT